MTSGSFHVGVGGVYYFSRMLFTRSGGTAAALPPVISDINDNATQISVAAHKYQRQMAYYGWQSSATHCSGVHRIARHTRTPQSVARHNRDIGVMFGAGDVI